MTDVNASGWDAPAAIVFTNTDTTTLRDMDLFLRYDDRMDEDTLTVRIAVVTPDSLRARRGFRLALPPRTLRPPCRARPTFPIAAASVSPARATTANRHTAAR